MPTKFYCGAKTDMPRGKVRGTQQQCKSQVRLFGMQRAAEVFPDGLGGREANRAPDRASAFCGASRKPGALLGSLGQCKSKRQLRHYGLVTPADPDWDPMPILQQEIGDVPEVPQPQPIADAEVMRDLVELNDVAEVREPTPPPPAPDAPVDPVETVDLTGEDLPPPPLPNQNEANTVDLTGEEEEAPKKEKGKKGKGKGKEKVIDLTEDDDGVEISEQVPEEVSRNTTRTKWAEYQDLDIQTTGPPRDGVYYPRRMERVDGKFDFKDAHLEKLLGDKIAFKRAVVGDGNCFWYSFLVAKAFHDGRTVTQDELEKETVALREEVSEHLEEYLRRTPPIRGFGEWTKQNQDKFAKLLKNKQWASDDLIRLVAFHTGTDVFDVYLAGTGHSRAELKKRFLRLMSIPGSGDLMDKKKKSKNAPIYIYHNGNFHYEALIPQSDVRDVQDDPVKEPEPVDITNYDGDGAGPSRTTIGEDLGVDEEELEGLKGVREGPVEKSVQRLEEHLSDEKADAEVVMDTEPPVVVEEGNKEDEMGLPDAPETPKTPKTPKTIATKGDVGKAIPLELMANTEFMKSVEDEIMAYDGEDDPINYAPKRPDEVVTDTKERDEVAAVGRAAVKNLDHPAMKKIDAEDAARQFKKLNPSTTMEYKWVPAQSMPIDVQYVKVPGGLKVRAKFARTRPFVDWLLVAKSRMLKSLNINALGLYADQMLPAGKLIGLYTGRILGPFIPDGRDTMAGLRVDIATMLGFDDKLLVQTYSGTSAPMDPHLLVDGSRGGSKPGMQTDQTFDPNKVEVLFPWTYLHMANDPRGAKNPATGQPLFPNATFADLSPGLKVLNTIYPGEEIVWYYDDDVIDEKGNVTAGKRSKGRGYAKRLALLQKIARGDAPQSEFDAMMKGEKELALANMVDAMESVISHNKQFPPDPTKRTADSARRYVVYDTDVSDLEKVVNIEGLHEGRMAKLRQLVGEYKELLKNHTF
eukprot:jgi/Mesvir1/18593/Mv17102-RA.1